MSEYKSAFFIVPSRISELPGVTLAYLKVYEAIYQFWNHDKPCWLSNQKIMEMKKIESQATVKKAMAFFEKHGELKREMINGTRYLVSPTRKIEHKENEGGAPSGAGGGSKRSGGGAPSGAHNKKNINNKKLREPAPSGNDQKQSERPLRITDAHPQGFKPSDECVDFCKQQGHDPEKVINKFMMHALASGMRSYDWNASLIKWIIDEKQPNKTSSKQQYRNESVCTVKEWGPGHPDWERQHA